MIGSLQNISGRIASVIGRFQIGEEKAEVDALAVGDGQRCTEPDLSRPVSREEWRPWPCMPGE